MNYTKLLTLSLLVGLTSTSFAASAETTETTVKTTTVTTGSSNPAMVTLSDSNNYLVVDPITGMVQGNYEQAARMVNGHNLQPGSVIIDASTGKLVATVDSLGNTVDIAAVPATTNLIVSIDSRRKELDRQIADALSKGQINAKQAAALRNDLEGIASDELTNSRASGTLSFQKALFLGYGLNTLSERLVPVTSTTVITPVVAPQFVTMNGQLTMVDNIMSRRLRMERRVEDEYKAGHLSADQVAKLKSELNKVASLETKYRRDGQLSDAKDRTLSIKLDEIQTAFGHDIAIINEKRSDIGLTAD